MFRDLDEKIDDFDLLIVLPRKKIRFQSEKKFKNIT